MVQKSTCLERPKSLQNRPRFSSNRSRNKNLTRDRTRRWTAGPANLWLCYGLLSRSSERAPGLVSCREVPMGRHHLRARFRTSFSVNGFFPRRNQKIHSIRLRSLHCSPHVAIRPHHKLYRLIALVPIIRKFQMLLPVAVFEGLVSIFPRDSSSLQKRREKGRETK